MKNLNLKHLVFALSINFIFGTTTQANTVWTAIEVGNNIVTSNEVAKFIDAIVISPAVHADLYKKSQGDYAAYKEQKGKLTAELFKETTAQMAIIRILQAQAIRTTERKFFALSSEQQSAQYLGAVKLALAPFQKKGLTPAKVKELFVNDLKAKGAPHDTQASIEAVYGAWSKQLKIRLTEQYRQKEAIRYLCSMGDCETYGSTTVFNKLRNYFEKDNHVVVRYNEEEKLKGSAAFDSLTYKSEAQEKNTESDNPRKTIYYIGKIVDEKTELVHINDWNLLGSLGTSLGYPETDDEGRTSGTSITHTAEGAHGSLSVEVENWLFSEQTEEVDNVRYHNVEEETSVRVVSKHFLDEKGDKWVIVGVSATRTVQKEDIGAWLQENFHKLNPSSSKDVNLDRDGVENYVQGLFGVGGEYSIVDTDHVDLVISGEGILAPSIGIFSESSIIVKSALDLNVYGKNKELPVLQIGVFAELALKASGQIETKIGAKVTVAKTFKRVRLEVGLFVIRWEGELDKRYEGGESWTTGILISATINPRKKIVNYAFN